MKEGEKTVIEIKKLSEKLFGIFRGKDLSKLLEETDLKELTYFRDNYAGMKKEAGFNRSLGERSNTFLYSGNK